MTPWFDPQFIGSIPCLDSLVLDICMLLCKPDTTICIYKCTLKNLCATNVNILNPLAPATSHNQFPDHDTVGNPWDEVAVDLICPWAASTPHGIVEFFALTCIDTTTNLVKITLIFKIWQPYCYLFWAHLALSVPLTNAWQWGREKRFCFPKAFMLVEHKTSSNHKQEPAG